MKSRWNWLFNCLLLLVAFAVTIACMEIAVRIISPQPTSVSHQDRFGLALHWPGLKRFLPQYGHSVSFNKAGMRDREHSIEPPKGVYRVLLFGDSFMEALQVPFDSAFPSLLEHQLNREERPVEVVSAAVSGWGTDDELRYLERYGMQYKPNLVLIAMTLHNDISDNLRQEWHRLKDGRLEDVNPPPIPGFQFAILKAKAFLATRFQLYQLWRRVRHGGEMRQIATDLKSHMVTLFEHPPHPTIAQGMTLTDSLLGRIQKLAQQGGAQVAIVLLPLRVQLSDTMFASLVRTTGIPAENMVLDEPQRDLEAIAARQRIPVIDLLPAFRQWSNDSTGSLFLERDGHWNEAGHRLAALVVSKALVPSLEVK